MIESLTLDIKNKEAVIAWLERIREGSGDATPLWIATTPKIIEFVDYELDPNRDAHKLWKRLSPKYLLWKIKHKGVSGIGYLTGTMREAAGKEAFKIYNPKSLLWKVNTTITNKESGVSVGKYVYAFHYGRDVSYSKKAEKALKKAKKLNKQPARPLYKYTALRINNFLKLDAKKFNTGDHASFTYNWLRKSLESYKK